MSKLSSQEMYLYDLFYFDSKSKLNEYSRKTNKYIFSISHIFSRFEYHICYTYYNWFVFEESHAKTLKNSNKILLRIKVLFKNVSFIIKMKIAKIQHVHQRIRSKFLWIIFTSNSNQNECIHILGF